MPGTSVSRYTTKSGDRVMLADDLEGRQGGTCSGDSRVVEKKQAAMASMRIQITVTACDLIDVADRRAVEEHTNPSGPI
jgi:hypothetical protein